MLTCAPVAAAQTPRLSNGRLENHTVSAGLAKDLPALAATLTEPTWIGYAQPLIDGEHEMCDYWNDGIATTQSTDPIRLEPADFFFVMFRVEDEADHAHSHLLGQLPARCRRQGGALVHQCHGRPTAWPT